jgi:hypothetical protein
MKREIPILLTVVCGLLITWAFFSPSDLSQAVNSELTAWATIFFSVAFILGISNLVRISLKQIANRHPDSIYKVILLVVLFGYLAVGFYEIFASLNAPEGSTQNFNLYRDWIYSRVFQPLQATMFSLLAFFIASAAFRAFRARSFEATLLLTAGALVMLGQVPMPVDSLAPVGLFFQEIQAFLMAYINAAGQKAIIIGSALGILATGLRIVLGIERSYLSE